MSGDWEGLGRTKVMKPGGSRGGSDVLDANLNSKVRTKAIEKSCSPRLT
jgi:hypothetical protein